MLRMGSLDELEVIVIGAGSAGLLIAQGLKQNGIQCTVFEHEDSTTYQTRQREWGMTLHWGAEALAKCLPPRLLETLNEGICCDPFYTGEDMYYLPNYNGKTGEKMFDMPGNKPRRISRRKLRNFLSQDLDIQYAKRLCSIISGPDDSITANFEDGSSAVGTFLIGCDGSKSIVRETLVGKENAKLGDLDIYMFNVCVPFSASTAKLQRQGHPIFKCAFHPTQPFVWYSSIQDVKDPDRPETWLFQHNFSWMHSPTPQDLPDPASRLAWWKSRAAEYADPWRTVGKELPEDLNLGIDRIRVWRPDMDWSQTPFGRRVTIVGDAAHCMPPHRGQGLNNALQDSATLVEELVAVKNGAKSLAEAVDVYEKEMKERSLQEIPISVRTAQAGHDWEKLMDTPAIKMGMNRYKEDRASKHEKVELAA